jgi:plastocyanin
MSVSTRSRIVGSLVALVLVTAAAVMLPATPAGATTKTINGVVQSGVGHWQPASISIVHGTTIHWHAFSGSHTIRAFKGWSFSRSLPHGTTVSRLFNTKGVFHYYCTIHGFLDAGGVCHGMCGKITVT